MTKNVLIIAAHADDEVLGCGGAIAKHVDQGDTVFCIFLADGLSSRANVHASDFVNRNAAAEEAREILGIRKNFYLGLPDNRLDSMPLIEVVQRLEPLILNLEPNIIYTHHYGDLNVDHQVAHRSVITACRPIPGSSVNAIYAFEVMSSTDWSNPHDSHFAPNHYVDIGNHLNKKLEALEAYKFEMRDEPHSRSMSHLKNLAYHRGNTIGVLAAEAFVTIRTIK